MPTHTLEWRKPKELKVTDDLPKDDPYLAEYVDFYRSGEQFPGQLSPEAIFADFAFVSDNDTANIIRQHCRSRGYYAHIERHNELQKLAFFRLDRPSAAGAESVSCMVRPIEVEILAQRKGVALRNYVYFIAAPEVCRVKIGFSHDINGRLASLSTSSPTELVFLGAIPGNSKTERLLHKRFSHLRVRGEWFDMDKELETYIRNAIRKNGV